MSLLDQPRSTVAEDPRVDAAHVRRRRRLWAGAVVGLLLGGWLLAPYAVRIEAPRLEFDADAGLMVEG